MTHPHRINTVPPSTLAKALFWGCVQGGLSVGIPVLIAWLLFGHHLPRVERPAPPQQIEARLDV